jgi:hypothetical protein
MKTTTEKAFETYIQETLLGSSGWALGDVGGWDRDKGIFLAVTGKIDVRGGGLRWIR